MRETRARLRTERWEGSLVPDDPHLADRMRAALKGRAGITEKKMFGGYCWMLRGNMLCGVEVGRVGACRERGGQNAAGVDRSRLTVRCCVAGQVRHKGQRN